MGYSFEWVINHAFYDNAHPGLLRNKNFPNMVIWPSINHAYVLIFSCRRANRYMYYYGKKNMESKARTYTKKHVLVI